MVSSPMAVAGPGSRLFASYWPRQSQNQPPQRAKRLARSRVLTQPSVRAVVAFCGSLPRCRDGVPGRRRRNQIPHDHRMSPHIDRINVTTSASMDVGKPHARRLADCSEVSNYCAKLARKCRQARQSPRSTMTLMPRPHRYGGIVSPQAANLEPASRH